MPSLRNRTFLITGATDGLGRGVAEHLAHDGAARQRLWDLSVELTGAQDAARSVI